MSDEPMSAKIENEIKTTKKVLESMGYSVEGLSARGFLDFMTIDTFFRDATTLDDVFRNGISSSTKWWCRIAS